MQKRQKPQIVRMIKGIQQYQGEGISVLYTALRSSMWVQTMPSIIILETRIKKVGIGAANPTAANAPLKVPALPKIRPNPCMTTAATPQATPILAVTRMAKIDHVNPI
jgi:hypothetical protein